MIFGGYGRKTKDRGELIYLCFECKDVTSHRLMENYKYEHLYGVRVAKHGTHRMLVCSRCQRGWDLDKAQWNEGKALAKQLQGMPGELTDEQVIDFCLQVADAMFPDQAVALRALLEDDDDDEPQPDTVNESEDSDGPSAIASGDDLKVCPDCAELVKAAARKCRFCGYRFDEA